MSNVVTKKTKRLKDDNIEKIVNTRAVYRLEQTVSRKVPSSNPPIHPHPPPTTPPHITTHTHATPNTNQVMLGNIPKIDDFLDEVQEAIDSTAGGGDDVDDAEELEQDGGSEDDEEYDVEAV